MILLLNRKRGYHLLPYSWLYKSKSYKIFSIFIPVFALILGSVFNGFILSATLTIVEIIFVISIHNELRFFESYQ
ncbi:DUF7010 family protein [Lachnobacterium bovis]|uniref:DUF7010 family protein n=1 Tax=Lachnobacterium bovis TaxID=140626 RepID=UPI0009436384